MCPPALSPSGQVPQFRTTLVPLGHVLHPGVINCCIIHFLTWGCSPLRRRMLAAARHSGGSQGPGWNRA